jgi:hypothetical protein
MYISIWVPWIEKCTKYRYVFSFGIGTSELRISVTLLAREHVSNYSITSR